MRFAALLPILTALAYTATSSAAPTTHPTDLLQPRYIKPNITHIDCSNDPYEHAPGKVNVWFEGVDEITGQTAQIRSGVPEHCGSTWRFDPATMEDNRFAVRKGGKYYLCHFEKTLNKGQTAYFTINTNPGKEGIGSPCISGGVQLHCESDLCPFGDITV